jgi:hypothetical protein
MTTADSRLSGGNGELPGSRPELTLQTLESLSTLSTRALANHYRGAAEPRSVVDLDGLPQGRLLTLTGQLGRGLIGKTIRRFAASESFPWLGKRFESSSTESGDGVNRFKLFGERELFRFNTRIVPSLLDGKSCICLDYNRRGNPIGIRSMWDELREVSPGLFMGPGFFRVGGRQRLLLFFAVESAVLAS